MISGDQPSEAMATMKYNRNRNTFTTQIQIPDFDVESGIKIGVLGNSARGKSIIFEISNKNEPQLSLIGRAKCVKLCISKIHMKEMFILLLLKM